MRIAPGQFELSKVSQRKDTNMRGAPPAKIKLKLTNI